MQLVMNPSQFDVMITPNLYGNIITNIVAGVVGSPGVLPGATYGRAALFEAGAHHVASNIAGKNIVNPTGFLLSSALMLRHLKLDNLADQIERSVFKVLSEQKVVTQDLGGVATTKQFTQAEIVLRNSGNFFFLICCGLSSTIRCTLC